jgi:hypothetical protein
VISAYYPAAVTAADVARDRAQRAYGVSSAIAAALATAGFFAGIAERPWQVQIAGGAALTLWLLTACTFMYTVGASAKPHREPEPDSADAFVRSALARAREERDAVNIKQRTARLMTVAAVIATLGALLLALVLPGENTYAELSISPGALRGLVRACGPQDAGVQGSLLETTPLPVERDVVMFEPLSCRRAGTIVQIPRSEIITLSTVRSP